MGLAVLIDQDKLRVVHHGKVVKSSDYAAVVSAQDMLRQAEHAAGELQQQARADYQQQHEAGYRDGWTQAQAQFTQRALSLATEQTRQLEALQPRIVEVVMRALRAILHQFDEQALLEQSLRRVAQMLREEKFVVLRVSPQQTPAAHATLANLTQRLGIAATVEVRADPRLAQGGCVVESAHGVIDASLDTQLAAIEHALTEQLAC